MNEIDTLLNKYKKNYGSSVDSTAVGKSDYLRKLVEKVSNKERYVPSKKSRFQRYFENLYSSSLYGNNRPPANESIDSLLWMDDMKLLLQKISSIGNEAMLNSGQITEDELRQLIK